MAPAVGDPGTTLRRLAAMDLASPATVRFVCLGLEGEPYRTAGNDGVPLQ